MPPVHALVPESPSMLLEGAASLLRRLNVDAIVTGYRARLEGSSSQRIDALCQH